MASKIQHPPPRRMDADDRNDEHVARPRSCCVETSTKKQKKPTKLTEPESCDLDDGDPAKAPEVAAFAELSTKSNYLDVGATK